MNDQPSNKSASDLADRATSMLNRPGKLKINRPVVDMEPRKFPKGTTIHKNPTSPDSEAIVSLRTHLRNWWILPYVLGPVILLLAIPIGIYSGIVGPEYYTDNFGRGRYAEGYFTIIPLIIALAVVIVAVFLLYQLTNPVTRITITPSTVTIGKYRFKREHSKGLRMGYEVTHDTSNSSMLSEKQIFFTGLRLSYGPWGEDLPYMVNKYHGAEYVNWINSILDYVGSPEPQSTAPEEGRREQRF